MVTRSPEFNIQPDSRELLLGQEVKVGVFALNPDGSKRDPNNNIQVHTPHDTQQAKEFGCVLFLGEGHGRNSEYFLSKAISSFITKYYYGEGFEKQKGPDLVKGLNRAFEQTQKGLLILQGRKRGTVSGAALAILPDLRADRKKRRLVVAWAGKVRIIGLDASGKIRFRSRPHVLSETEKILTRSLTLLQGGPEMKKLEPQKGMTLIFCTSRVGKYLSDKEIEKLRKKISSPEKFAQRLVKEVHKKREYRRNPSEKRVLAAAVLQF